MIKVDGLWVPPWMVNAQNDIGVRERPGRRNHPRIVEFHQTTAMAPHMHRDAVAWCSSAVNCWVEEAGYEGTDSAWAMSWAKWGEDAWGKYGAITVISRRIKRIDMDPSTGSHSGNHVALFAGQSDSYIRLLGGNQRNRVRYSNYPLRIYNVVAMRYPKGLLT